MYIQMLGDYSTLPTELWDHLKVATVFWNMLRSVGFMLLKGLAKLIDEAYEAVNFVLSLDLYSLVKKEYPQIFNAIPSLVWSLFALALMIVGFKLASSRDRSDTGRTVKGILTSALWIVALPTFINVMADMQQAGIKDIDSMQVSSGSSIGETMLSSLVIDIDASKVRISHPQSAYTININDVLDNEGFWDKKPGTIADSNSMYYDNILSSLVLQEVFGVPQATIKEFFRSGGVADNSAGTVGNCWYLVKREAAKAKDDESIMDATSLTELFLMEAYRDEVNAFISSYDPSSYASTINSYTLHYLFTQDDYDSLSSTEKIEKTITSGLTPVEYLYAYDFYFVNGLLVMLTALISLIFAGFKGGKLLYDLVFNQIIAPLVIATDLQESGRAKKIISQLISTYLIFIVILFVLKIYLMVVLFVINAQYNLIVQIILILAGMAFVIDGPDFVVQLLGIDAGVKSGAHALIGVHAGINVAKSAGGIIKRGISAVPFGNRSSAVGEADPPQPSETSNEADPPQPNEQSGEEGT